MATNDLRIEAVRDPGTEHVAAMARLLPQLSDTAPPDLEQLRAIAAHQGTTLLFAFVSGQIVGTLTLSTFTIPSGVRAWIEDVIVDESGRGKGIGAALVNHALKVAASSGACTVDLTSRPSRVAANRLYQYLGFVARETNVYRYLLDAD